jgi:hypothetical protein
MTRSMRARQVPVALWLVLAAPVVAAACEEKKSASEGSRGDSGAETDKFATADPKLEKALKAAAAASGGSDNGPPPEGIFAPGVADQRHPKSAPTKVDMIADGSEPRVTLTSSGDAAVDSHRMATSYGPAVVQIGLQLGPRTALPNIDLALALGPARKDDGGDEWLVGTVRKALPSKEQLGQLPPGVDKQIGTLEGTQLRVRTNADGIESELQVQLGKNAITELERVAGNAGEALILADVPLPPKPVGAGAQWIAETRMPWNGIDVLAYRAYRVKDIDGDRLHLTLDVKAYATQKDMALPGIPKGATLMQFAAEGQGELDLVRGESLARRLTMQERLVMVFAQAGAPTEPSPNGEPQRGLMPVQMQGQTMLVRGDDLRTAAKP